MSTLLKGKTALVTGSSRGIGRAIAERLAADGATVVVNWVQDSRAAEQVVQGIKSKDGRAVAIQADVAKPREIVRLFDDAEKAVGGLDIVIANAGVFMAKPVVETEEEDFERVFNVNARGVFFTLKEAAKRVRDGGRIIAVSTGATELFFPLASLYVGSKAAVEQFTRSLSRELGARNITVNTLSPGFTDTEMLHPSQRGLGASLSPFGRIGSASEVADVAAFLASDAARWMTGQNVQANGGVV